MQDLQTLSFTVHVKNNRKFQGEKHHLWSIFLCQKHICELLFDILIIKNYTDHFLGISSVLVTLPLIF